MTPRSDNARRRPLRQLVRDDSGMTLVELLTTMALGTVVLLAILLASDLFGGGVSRADRLADTQESARSALREMTTQMRDSRPAAADGTPLAIAPLPTRNSVVFAARRVGTDPATAVPGWMRYCTTTTSGTGDLLVGRLASSSFTAPGTCALGNTAGGWRYSRLLRTPLTDTRVFDYTTPSCVGASCTPTAAAAVRRVTSIGIALSIDARFGSGSNPRPYGLRGAVALRNRIP